MLAMSSFPKSSWLQKAGFRADGAPLPRSLAIPSEPIHPHDAAAHPKDDWAEGSVPCQGFGCVPADPEGSATAAGRWLAVGLLGRGFVGDRFVALLCGLLAMLPCDPAVALEGVRITGRVQAQTHTGPTPTTLWEQSFEVASLGASWRIHTFDSVQSVRSLFGSDGHSVYSARIFPNPMPGRREPAVVALVQPGAYPYPVMASISGPWFAWCSRGYFQGPAGAPNGRIPIPADWQVALPRSVPPLLSARYMPCSDGSGFPARIEVYPNRELIQALLRGGLSGRAGRGEANIDPWRPRLVRLAEVTEPVELFEVLRTRECAGIQVPAVWRLITFASDSSTDGTRDPVHVYTAEAEVIEPITELDPLPRWEGLLREIRVTDYRFTDATLGVPFHSYVIRNWAWYTNPEDPHLQKLWAESLDRERRHRSRPRVSRELGLAIYLAMFFSPLFFPSVRRQVRDTWNRFTGEPRTGP